MLTSEEIEARRELIQVEAGLSALLDHVLARSRATVRRDPAIPALKGMLSADGGVCPEDRSALVFDPWNGREHRCSRCGTVYRGERHDRRWAWLEHLWLAERIVEAAATGLFAEDESLIAWAAQKLAAYGARYREYPNVDNVLGPARLFFSTYLESIWLTNYLAGAFLLRESGMLDEAAQQTVSDLVEEAAGLIGEFDEGLSNRQTWHNAALSAAAVWFEDEELARRAIEGPRGLVGHLVDGFRDDGMWYEGENYHLFALQGLLTGAAWARLAGVDLFEAETGQTRLAAALRAPALSALPDGTFPARKDARYGVSLAQPMYLEMWENGIGTLRTAGYAEPMLDLGSWLGLLYQLPAPAALTFDSYLHEAGTSAPPTRSRADLSWWMLATMPRDLPGADQPWTPASVLLPEQGIAILRDGDRYASLECGEHGGGHGHGDRLHLTLHADGAPWLLDPGTGSYVSPDLMWYRGTLAHNAPRLDGRSQPPADARAEMFDTSGPWGWVRGRVAGFTRTLVAGPSHVVDILEFAGEEEHLVELPWHPVGELEILTPGGWEPAELQDPFVHDVERFLPSASGPISWRATLPHTGQVLTGAFDAAGDLLRVRGPGRPGEASGRAFLLRRLRGRYVRFATVLGFGTPGVVGVEFPAGEVRVETTQGTAVHRQTEDGWEIALGESRVRLRGALRTGLSLRMPLGSPEVGGSAPLVATATHLPGPPALDGTLAGFDTDQPILLDHDDQYRRTEEPYPGPEEFSARAWFAWDAAALYVAVEVIKSAPLFRRRGAPPLRLDNEVDLIHSDGVQLYVEVHGHGRAGWLIVPDPDSPSLQAHSVPETGARGEVRGAWRATDTGYRITCAVSPPGWPPAGDEPVLLDLIVNEMREGRQRRLGQLVWTGGGGWAYLRGDRQEADRAGRLVLA